jgi:hypothetical protein
MDLNDEHSSEEGEAENHETDAKGLDHELQIIEGEELSVLIADGQRYLIGVQVAHLLKRETFNMYRSMKIKGVELLKAESDQVEYMITCGAVRSGTHSVTLIPIDQAKQFIQCMLEFHRCSG